jgi:uncharacterized protein YkwD
MTKPRVTFVLSVLLALFQVGCGSGESSQSVGQSIGPSKSTTMANDSTVQSIVIPRSLDTSLQASVPRTTYAANSQELAAFSFVNERRGSCGFGLLKQDSRLDSAALAHAKYVAVPSTAAISHTESKAVSPPLFTGVNPIDRVLAQGYPSSLPYVDEDFGAGFLIEPNFAETLSSDLMNAPFHLVSMLRANRDVGIGIHSADRGPNSLPFRSVVFNMATTVATQEPTDVQTFPCNGSVVPGVFFGGESPEPFPGRNYAASPMGSPIAVMARTGTTLVLNSYSLRQQGDNRDLALNVLSSLNRSVSIRGNEVVLMPDLPLAIGTKFDVSLTGTLNGVSWSKVFSFSTAK